MDILLESVGRWTTPSKCKNPEEIVASDAKNGGALNDSREKQSEKYTISSADNTVVTDSGSKVLPPVEKNDEKSQKT